MSKKLRLYNDVLRALSMVLDFDDGQQLYHAWRVGMFSFRLAEYMGLNNKNDLYVGGLLHDIGGIGLQDHLIHHAIDGFKNDQAKRHPQKGAVILSSFDLFKPIIPFVVDHHERYDGRGFPFNKAGNGIPLEAAIILLADILDISLRSSNVMDKQKIALAIVAGEAGRAVDPVVAEAAIGLFNEDDTLISTLFNDASLKTWVHAVNIDPPGIGKISCQEMLNHLLWIFAQIIDAKSQFALGHSNRVAYYALRIAEIFGKGEINKGELLWAALLHDVGVVHVPRYILQKPYDLTDEERKIYQRHAQATVSIIGTMADISYLAYPASAHHEWYDGSGYPRGNTGENIPLLGRILAYADSYDLFTSRYGGRKGLSHQAAIEKIKNRIGRQFDPHFAPLALEVLDGFSNKILQPQAEMEDFNLFFQTKQTDTASLVRDIEVRKDSASSADRGVILEDLKPWYTLKLSQDYQIISGKENLSKFTTALQSENFLDYLDKAGKSDFKKVISNLRPDRLFTRYFISASQHPLEAIITKNKDRYEVLYRSAAQKIDPLKRMSLLYRNFLTSAEGAVFVDPNGDIIDANRSFLDLYGYQLDEVTGQNLKMLKSGRHPSSTFDDMWGCLTDKNIGTWSGEMINRKKNGDEIAVLLTTNAIFDFTGTVVGYIGQHHDITERKKHEEALKKKDIELEKKNRELEKLNQLKSDMMAITSHDLKSPIAAMIGYADLIKSYMGQMSQEKVMHYLDGIMDAGHNQLKFIDDLLDLYKFESDAFSLEKKPTRLEYLLSESVEINAIVGKAKQVTICFTIEKSGSLTLADGVRIQQVFNNLLSNAIKYSPEGSQIGVHYREIDEKIAQITIDDQGPGVFEADLDRIFDRYYQAKNKGGGSERLHGVGLGLYISKHIVNLHDGTLQVENRPNCGCRFVVEIPLLLEVNDEREEEASAYF